MRRITREEAAAAGQGSLFDVVDAPTNPTLIIAAAPVSPARSTDPGTAHEAATANDEIRGAQRVQVLLHYLDCGGDGSTDYETGERLGILRTSAGKRRKELCEAGLISDSGRRRDTDTGSSAIVWVADEEAAAARGWRAVARCGPASELAGIPAIKENAP